jgi:hypothetical protein
VKIKTQEEKSRATIDMLCELLHQRGENPISPSIFGQFLKACRRQKDPKAVAKEHTTDIVGLIKMLEDNLLRTKDYNLRRRMKRTSDALSNVNE